MQKREGKHCWDHWFNCWSHKTPESIMSQNETKFRHEGDKVYAFKPQPHRFLCFFFTGQKIIVTNAFHKKTDKLPTKEKDRALKIKDDYELRIKRGDYYE